MANITEKHVEIITQYMVVAQLIHDDFNLTDRIKKELVKQLDELNAELELLETPRHIESVVVQPVFQLGVKPKKHRKR